VQPPTFCTFARYPVTTKPRQLELTYVEPPTAFEICPARFYSCWWGCGWFCQRPFCNPTHLAVLPLSKTSPRGTCVSAPPHPDAALLHSRTPPTATLGAMIHAMLEEATAPPFGGCTSHVFARFLTYALTGRVLTPRLRLRLSCVGGGDSVVHGVTGIYTRKPAVEARRQSYSFLAEPFFFPRLFSARVARRRLSSSSVLFCM